MNPTPATPSSPSMAVNKPQYHHYIPRFILRGFRQDSDPAVANSSTTTLTKQQKKKLKKANKDGLLHFIRIKDGALDTGLLSRHYGVSDMYRDVKSANPNSLEDDLATLEGQAATILAQARKTFEKPGASLTLLRPEKDILRIFLFIMKYRNMGFFSKFNVATIDDYNENDKETLRAYMEEYEFQSPKEVWYANMRTFLTFEMDAPREWHEKIKEHAYPDHAELFKLHVDQSYIAFCRPRFTRDEFLLTDNVFGIFEGPNSLAMDRVTGQTHRFWTEWHNFAPVSASLLIILRNRCLPNAGVFIQKECESGYRMLLASQPSPEQAVSMLEDLPIKPPVNTYSSTKAKNAAVNLTPEDLSSSDSTTFKCFDLRSKHVNLINSVFLEEAAAANTVTYKSDNAAARGIQTYLEDSRPGLKVDFRGDSQHGMSNHIEALGTALQALGSTNGRGQST